LIHNRFSFSAIPLALSVAASVRISQLVVSQNHNAARISANIVIWITFFAMCGSGYLMYQLRYHISYLFTLDKDIAFRSTQIAFIAAVFQVPYGVQGSAQGILRGLTRNSELLGYTILTFWMVSLPLGVYLCFYARPSFGIQGMWYGFITGVGLLCVLLVGIIWTTDWEYEVRRARIHIEKYQSNGFRVVQAAPMIGSRALGGFLLFSNSGEEELDEIERLEVNIDPDAIEDEDD
jgi:MATE family multidrug resistance protein